MGRPRGSRSGSSGTKICDDCGGDYVDSWKHRRQCTAHNKDIKYVCHECRKGFRRLGAVKKHFKLSRKCKESPQNLQEYQVLPALCSVKYVASANSQQKLMKYVENDVKGRTVCQDCGCEYVTR